MKEWWVWYDRIGTYEEESLIVFRFFVKVLLWLFLNAWNCSHIEIIIQYTGGKNGSN